MTNLIVQLAEIRDSRSVDRLIEKNIQRLTEPDRNFLCRLANLAKIRIARVKREQKRYFINQLN